MKGAYRLFITAFAVAVMAWTAQATMVTFQVDMTAQEGLGSFVPAEDIIVVRGSFQNPAWQVNDTLSLNGAIYTKVIEIPDGNISYKFVNMRPSGDVWERSSTGDRTAVIAGETQILPVVYFDDVLPTFPANVEVLFSVDMSVQLATGLFNAETDWVVVRGGHDSLYNWGGDRRLTPEPGNLSLYTVWVLLDSIPANAPFGYKYYKAINGDLTSDTGWESITGNRFFTPTGDEPDNLPPLNPNGFGEIILDTPYFSNAGPEDIILNELDVLFRVELTPLLGRLADNDSITFGGTTIYDLETVHVAGFFYGWPWGEFPDDKALNDEGLNGDETAGDNVFSGTIVLPAGTSRDVGYKYGANEIDNEAGFAMNHFRRIENETTGQVFVFPIDCWGSPDTLYADWPCVISAADEPGAPMPDAYSLSQNYPNPFNPTTTINFSLPIAENVKLVVFDLLGRQVSSMDFGRVNAGTHNIEFDGSAFASGVYFYRLETANFAATKKMLMLK